MRTKSEYLDGSKSSAGTARTKLAYNNQKAILTEELQLPVFERDPNQPSLAWAPPRPLDPALFAPVSFDRRYSAEWWWVNEEEACALRERQDREAAPQAAEALENWRGPQWWEGDYKRAALRHAESVGEVIDSSCPQTDEVPA